MTSASAEIHPLKIADFRFYWMARFMAVLATMGMVVVIAYQAYDIARSDYGMSIREASFQLGLLGLFQFVPLAVLTPVAGWVADRFERRSVAIFSNLIDLLIAATLTLSYLMRRPSPSGDGVTLLDPALDEGHAPLLEVAKPEGLLSAAQMNVVEFHTWNARKDRIERPDRITFDLDPGDGIQL